jgi:hypothetical protein
MRNSDPPIQADRLAGVNRASTLRHSEQLVRRDFESATKIDNARGCYSIFSAFVFLYLLEGQTEDLAQLALAHSKVCNRFERIVEPIFLSTAVRRIRITRASKIESWMIVIVFTPMQPAVSLRKRAAPKSRPCAFTTPTTG